MCFNMQDLKAFEVDTLVRVCTATYDKTPVEQEGIRVLVGDLRNSFSSSFILRIAEGSDVVFSLPIKKKKKKSY